MGGCGVSNRHRGLLRREARQDSQARGAFHSHNGCIEQAATKGLSIMTDDGSAPMPCSPSFDDDMRAEAIEMAAAQRSIAAGFGASGWDMFLTLGESKSLVSLADRGAGTWAREPAVLESMRRKIAEIDAKTD
jgi:hypothetical protein